MANMARIGKLLLDCFLCCVVAFVSLIFMSVTATFVTAAWIWSIVQEASGKVKMQPSRPSFPSDIKVVLPPELLQRIFLLYIQKDEPVLIGSSRLNRERCTNVAVLSRDWRKFGQKPFWGCVTLEVYGSQPTPDTTRRLDLLTAHRGLAQVVDECKVQHDLYGRSTKCSVLEKIACQALDVLPALTTFEAKGVDLWSSILCLQRLAEVPCRFTLTRISFDMGQALQAYSSTEELRPYDVARALAVCPNLEEVSLECRIVAAPVPSRRRLSLPLPPLPPLRLLKVDPRNLPGIEPSSSTTFSSLVPALVRLDALQVLRIWWSPQNLGLLEWLNQPGFKLKTLELRIFRISASEAYEQVLAFLPFHPYLTSFHFDLKIISNETPSQAVDQLSEDRHLRPLIAALPSTLTSLHFPFPYSDESELPRCQPICTLLEEAFVGVRPLKEVKWRGEPGKSVKYEWRERRWDGDLVMEGWHMTWRLDGLPWYEHFLDDLTRHFE